MSDTSFAQKDLYITEFKTVATIRDTTISETPLTESEKEVIIESGSNTVNPEQIVTPNRFTLNYGETYKIIKSTKPFVIKSKNEQSTESTPTVLHKTYSAEDIQFLMDEISMLRSKNFQANKKNETYLEQLRELKAKNRKLGAKKQDIRNEVYAELQLTHKEENQKMKEISNIQTNFLLEGFVLMLIAIVGFISYYAFDLTYFTPILYSLMFIAGMGWFLTAFVSIRRN